MNKKIDEFMKKDFELKDIPEKKVEIVYAIPPNVITALKSSITFDMEAWMDNDVYFQNRLRALAFLKLLDVFERPKNYSEDEAKEIEMRFRIIKERFNKEDEKWRKKK